MIRRIVLISLGYVVAVGVGAIFLVVSALFDPATREAGFSAAMAGVFAIINDALRDGDPQQAMASFYYVVRAVIVATCAAPLAVAALIGELSGARSIVWYSGSAGVLAGASPWIARAAKGLDRAQSVTPLEGRVALLFFLTGAVAGAVYWLIGAPPAPADLATTARIGPPRKE